MRARITCPARLAETVSAMMKSEENRGKGFKFVWGKITDKGLVGGVHRLWFGAATRSLRTGGGFEVCTLSFQRWR